MKEFFGACALLTSVVCFPLLFQWLLLCYIFTISIRLNVSDNSFLMQMRLHAKLKTTAAEIQQTETGW